MGSKIVNPSAGTYFYNVSGSAISAQPNLVTGTTIGLGSNQTLMDNVAFGQGQKDFIGSRVYPSKRTQVLSAKLGTAVTGATVAAVGGYAKYTKSGHSVVVGDILFVTDTNGKVDGVQRVTAKTSTTFTTDMPYVSGAGTLTYKVSQGTIAYWVARNTIMPFKSVTINGVANTVLRSPGSDYGTRRNPNRVMNGIRTALVATAIRAGYWNIYTATWSTAPSASNANIGNVAGASVTDGSADHEANNSRSDAAEFVYMNGKPAPVQDDYDLKTG